eukprot:scaffold10898_cov59-Phaeocystis_antarctica.AAC.1
MENASSISKPPIFFAARPVVAPKALFIGVCICLSWGRGVPRGYLGIQLQRLYGRVTTDSIGRDAHAENVGYVGVVRARVPSVVGLSVVR